MIKEKRNRKRMGFWIDYGKDDDLLVAETIDTLKGMRKYQRAILQGIQLIASLWEGRVDVLLAMFPWVADTIISQSTKTPPDTSNLERKIDRVEKILLEQGNLPTTPLVGAPLKHSTLHPAPAPVITQAATVSAGTITDNFMASLGF